jgi:subtilisin family serine protease
MKRSGSIKMLVLVLVMLSIAMVNQVFSASLDSVSTSQCKYGISPTSAVFTTSGGTGSFDVSVAMSNYVEDMVLKGYTEPNYKKEKFLNFKMLSNKANSDGNVRVIVRLSEPFTPEGILSAPASINTQRSAIAMRQDRLLSEMTGQKVSALKRFKYIPYIALETDSRGLSALYASNNVEGVYEDKLSSPLLPQSVPLIQGNQAWNAGFTGAGQTVAILDTGVERGHPFFTGKIVYEACYSTNGTGSVSFCPNGQDEQIGTGAGADCPSSVNGCGHGTHVAGIAAGKGQSFSGVAKDANIMAFQVFTRFDSSESCDNNPPCAMSYDSDQLKALEKVYELRNSYNISSVNMSLGSGKYTTNCDSQNPSLKNAIDNLRSVGIATVIASGNDGHTDGISSPACISTAISVGSTTKSDSVSDFSNSASILHLLAPGSSINSSVLNGQFGFKSGTSMAAPHVAGAWAIMTQKNPNASVSQTLQAFQSTGAMITDIRNGIVKPRINIKSALDSFDVNCPWTAVSNDNWITITSGGQGTSNGQTSYSVSAAQNERIGTITVQGQQYTVLQTDASFADVSRNSVFHNYILAIYIQRVTIGCDQAPLRYCPFDNVTRGQMAAFIIRAKFGENFTYTQTPHFTDVPATHNFFKYVQKMKDEGITTGYGDGTYGVSDFVTRGQMAAFIIRAKFGENFTYTQTPHFTDVPSSHPFFKYIQRLKDEGITVVSGTYNPLQEVPREQMAAFIGRGFIGMK